MHTPIHPAVIYRWKRARLANACWASQACGPEANSMSSDPGVFASGSPGGSEGGAFGVRRPLRFLAYKLGLNENQVIEMARLLNELKTERAQAAVDDRRAQSALADVLAGETFDEALANRGIELRRQGDERLGQAVVKALGGFHKLLNAEQRERLAYLVRTGALMI